MKCICTLIFTIFLSGQISAQDSPEAILDALPPIPQNATRHDAKAISQFELRCQSIIDRLNSLLEKYQAETKEAFKPELEKTKSQGEIVKKMIDLQNKGELTDRQKAEFARQIEALDRQQPSPLLVGPDPKLMPEIKKVQKMFEELYTKRLELTREMPVVRTIDSIQDRYREALIGGANLEGIRAELTRAWRTRRQHFFVQNSIYLQKTRYLMNDNRILLDKSPEHFSALLSQFSDALRAYYTFYQVGNWETYLESYKLKEDEITRP